MTSTGVGEDDEGFDDDFEAGLLFNEVTKCNFQTQGVWLSMAIQRMSLNPSDYKAPNA